MIIELMLPIPCTINKLYHTKKNGGKSKSKKGKDWVRDAKYYAQPYLKEYKELCKHNVKERNSYWIPGKKCINLKALMAAHPRLSYQVTYTYVFEDDIPRDVFNFEKQLSDLLCDLGFMLDDCFIDEGTLKRRRCQKDNAHVHVQIKVVDRNDVLY